MCAERRCPGDRPVRGWAVYLVATEAVAGVQDEGLSPVVVLSHVQTENLGRGLSGRQIGSDVLILYPLLSSPNLRTLKDTFNRPNGPPVPPP